MKDKTGKQYLIVMTGFPGAGKTEVATYLQKKLGFTRLSSDYLREAMFGFSDYHLFRKDPQHEEKELCVFNLLQNGKMICLARGLNIVVDSSAPDDKLRTELFKVQTNQEAKSIEKVLIYVRASEEILRERNLRKGRENDPIAEWKAVWDEPQENSEYRVLIYDNDTSMDLDAILVDIDKKFGRDVKHAANLSSFSKPYLGKEIEVIIDRPIGSRHPKHSFVYEANYGYIPGTKAPDGEELDAYVLGVETPIESFMGKCVAIIHRLNDDDDKLVVVPKSSEDMSDEEIQKATNFQEQFFQSEIIRL